MKKKYQQPLVRVQIVEGEPLLNGASVVDIGGKTQDTLGSDTTSGGMVGEGGTVWGDAKPYNPWTSWD